MTKTKSKGLAMEFAPVPRVESVEHAGGGRLRVRAVRSQSACGCWRTVWVFLASPSAIEVEDVLSLHRQSVRARWLSLPAVRHRLSDQDRRELAALAGQALARGIRSIGWLDELAPGGRIV